MSNNEWNAYAGINDNAAVTHKWRSETFVNVLDVNQVEVNVSIAELMGQAPPHKTHHLPEVEAYSDFLLAHMMSCLHPFFAKRKVVRASINLSCFHRCSGAVQNY